MIVARMMVSHKLAPASVVFSMGKFCLSCDITRLRWRACRSLAGIPVPESERCFRCFRPSRQSQTEAGTFRRFAAPVGSKRQIEIADSFSSNIIVSCSIDFSLHPAYFCRHRTKCRTKPAPTNAHRLIKGQTHVLITPFHRTWVRLQFEIYERGTMKSHWHYQIRS